MLFVNVDVLSAGGKDEPDSPEFPSLFQLKLSRPLQKKFYIKAALMSYSTESNNNKNNKRKYQKERHCSKPKHHTDNKESIH